MKSISKTNRIMTIVVSLLFFVSVIVLTNDYFDDLQSRDTILLLLVISQFAFVVYNLVFHKIKQ